MGKRVAIGNNKGGTGKSSSTVNLAAALAEQQRRVLVLDMDPQANTTRRLGVVEDPRQPMLTTTEVVASGEPGVAAQAIRPVGWPEPYRDFVSVIPARYDLENRVPEAGLIGAGGRLARAMQGADDEYDVTLIDLPPSLGHLTQLGLAAADAVLCTLEPEYDGVQGAVRFRDFVVQHAHHLRPDPPGLRLIGVIVCRARPTIGAHSYQISALPDLFGDLVWEPYLPERAAVKDASDTASPLLVYGGPSAREVAGLYSQLATRLTKELTA